MLDFNKKIIFLFDIDGIVLDTPHEEAWFDAAVNWGIIDRSFVFNEFYAKYVASQPGITGAKNILQYLHKEDELPYYQKEKIDTENLKLEAAKNFRIVKQHYLNTKFEEGKFRVYEDIFKILFCAKNEGILVGAISSSENAKTILKRINLQNLLQHLNIPHSSQFIDQNMEDIFDVTALGVITYWHGIQIDKAHHYAMAYGKMLCKLNQEEIPHVVVFEDAISGVIAATKLGFYCIGISRNPNSKEITAPKSRLLEVGANITYTEEEFRKVKYEELKLLICKTIKK
jgi:beta-phosphoglucomutase-like phosphatase (HAD superfamily)